MYAHFWSAGVWSTGALLWWLRSGRRVAWWAWVAAGCLMLGLHFTGVILLGVQAVLTLVSPAMRRWWTLPALGLGAAIMCVGPVYHYGLGEPGDWFYVESFNRYFDRAERRDGRYGGLEWIPFYNQGRDGGDYLLFTATAYLSGWEWPQWRGWSPARYVDRTTLTLLGVGNVALIGGLLLGALPWRGSEWPRWRSLVGLLVWLAVPVMAVYRLSVPDGAIDGGVMLGLTAAAVAAVAGVTLTRAWRDSAAGFGQCVPRAGVAVVLVTLVLSAVAYVVEPKGQSLWMPRYIGMLWPAVGILAAVLILRLPTTWLKVAVVGLFAILNLGQFYGRVVVGSEPPVDVFVADVLAAKRAGDGSVVVAWDQRFNAGERLWGGLSFADPGRGWIGTTPYLYYLATTDPDTPITEVAQVRGRGFGRRAARAYADYHTTFRPGWQDRLARVLDDRGAERFVVWQAVEPGRDAQRLYAGPLGAGWTLVSLDRHPVRDHWRWLGWAEMYRFEFRRVAG